MSEDPSAEIELVVESVRVHMLSDRHVVILKDSGHDRYLPIWIGRWEATAIASQLQGHVPERPMTHDLFATVLREASIRLDRIRISALQRETFHAQLVLVVDGVEQEIDARPSDAIALALRLGAPIFASGSVLEVASLAATDANEAADGEPRDPRSLIPPTRAIPPDNTPGGPPRAPALEKTGEPIDPRRLVIFEEFVNSLGAEGDQRGRPDSNG